MDGDADKTAVAFREVSEAIRRARFPGKVGAVVGILRGGRVPACLIAHELNVPLFFVRVRFRDDANKPIATDPRLSGEHPDLKGVEGTVLLVDDVSVTGATFAKARRSLGATLVTTVVLKGRADLVLMPDLPDGCVLWPWNERDDAPQA